MSMKRREFIHTLSAYGTIVGSAALLPACGAAGLPGFGLGGNSGTDNGNNGSNAGVGDSSTPAPTPAPAPDPVIITVGRATRLPRHQELRMIGAFYRNRASNPQEEQYNTKAYLAADTLAGGLGGLILDAADVNHIPHVKKIAENGQSYDLSIHCGHAVSAEHYIGGVDIWIDGDVSPTAQYVTPAADIAAGLPEFTCVVPIPKEILEGAQYVVLVSHCNLHGGHLNLNDGERIDGAAERLNT
ncbi:MAG: hypothetical protein P8104_02735 [Gammaproteobacteria bacterium]